MENLSTTKVSKIVAQNYRTAQVFSTYGIDFCCNGGIPLERACLLQNVDLQTITEEIKKALETKETENFSTMPIDQLVRYIEAEHHAYVRNTIPALTAYLEKLCRVHGERHPELFEISMLVGQSARELLLHMEKEEQILFPYIHALAGSVHGNYPLSPPHFGHLKNPINMMEEEHEKEGARFKKIAALSDNYTPPKDGCQTYQVTYMVLKEFETDLHMHIHLENNILFPKALDMFQSRIA